ncbi:hypothetical protein Krac_5444 [Ktedonobacter racemifer DSM 44963]|uniref:Uncharacterized protein n=1 Tax=Ktedonobacter racemifer DSM 44963 TaxID=485913 RepID=D6TW28_KTERA|nr:hypothetical protein Krac_3654 [Ktedonobacter racemifer DSM 44963]EFH84411.1 hypothetical protein Krac_5444 [Ktedonobacter racemifer DSM 44963]
MEEEPHFSFERKELKGSRRYHLVKPLSPSKLVHAYDGSVIPSIHSPVGEHFIMTARFRLLPPRTGGFLLSHIPLRGLRSSRYHGDAAF